MDGFLRPFALVVFLPYPLEKVLDVRFPRFVQDNHGDAGRLPGSPTQFTSEQNTFLDQAVAGLARDGKIISVRLALFAEMVNGKPWTQATLKDVGGTAGVGVAFLEETEWPNKSKMPERSMLRLIQTVCGFPFILRLRQGTAAGFRPPA